MPFLHIKSSPLILCIAAGLGCGEKHGSWHGEKCSLWCNCFLLLNVLVCESQSWHFSDHKSEWGMLSWQKPVATREVFIAKCNSILTADNYEQCDWAVLEGDISEKQGTGALSEIHHTLKPSPLTCLLVQCTSLQGCCVASRNLWEHSVVRDKLVSHTKQSLHLFLSC